MWNKKAKKLFRNPKLFFFDYFKHRLSDEELQKSLQRSNLRISSNQTEVLSVSSIKDNQKGPNNTVKEQVNTSNKLKTKDNAYLDQNKLTVDRITDINFLIESLFQYMLERTCFIQKIDVNNDHIFRIAVKSNDLNYVLNVMSQFSMDEFFIEEVTDSDINNKHHIRKFCFRNQKYIFKSIIIEIDPWFTSEKYGRIYTHNFNPFCTHVDQKYMNHTVFASNPYFLQGESHNVNKCSLNYLMDLPPAVYDSFDFDVDVVFTWVDGQDPDWLERKSRYERVLDKGNSENYSSARYEQIDELKYAMRSIASYFKGYRKIFIVTDKQIPWWLDTTHPQIEIVDHTAIFPDINVLPVFNSHAIEANLHRIKGLSKKFIYMNDDIFIWRPVTKSKFYTANGISISRFEEISNVHGEASATYPAWRSAALNGNKLLEERFSLKSYSYHLHCPHALDKEVIEDMWRDFEDEMHNVSRSRFRSHKDISPLSFFYHAYSFIKGCSIKEESGSSHTLMLNSANAEHVKALEDIIKDESSIDFVCLNDGGDGRLTNKVISALDVKFPIKAEWEL